MTPDWWAIILTALITSAIWGSALLVIISTMGHNRIHHASPMDGGKYTGNGSDSDR